MSNEFLEKEPIGKLLFKLSIPTLTAQIINMLYNIVDRIYIGHMPNDGEVALTGVGVCLPIIMIVSAFASLVSAGGAPRASIFMGQKDNVSAEKTLGACFGLQVVISIILTILLLIFNKPLLLTFGASENTIGYATSYMNIYAIGTIFVQLTLGMNAYITAQGFAKVGMLSVVIGALCNIILDPIFIYGFNMGVEGAALATILSQAASCIWIISFLLGKKTLLKLKKEYIKLDFKLVAPCLALGLAPFIMQASESIIIVCFNTSLYKYGGDIAVGAMTILSSVMQFALMPLQGFAQGAQPISSYNFGAKNPKRVVGTFKLLLTISLIYSFVLWALIMIFPTEFAKMFTSKLEYVDFASKALRVYCGVLAIFGLQIACQMTFVSIGSAGSSIIVAIVRKFILLLPLIYIMPEIMKNKVMAVYAAEPVADILAVTFTGILFFFQFKKSINKISDKTLY